MEPQSSKDFTFLSQWQASLGQRAKRSKNFGKIAAKFSRIWTPTGSKKELRSHGAKRGQREGGSVVKEARRSECKLGKSVRGKNRECFVPIGANGEKPKH